MANTYKNIIITPNISTTPNLTPNIRFSGGDSTTNTDIYLRVYTSSNGTISFEGPLGQIFALTNDLGNSIFTISDISGMPIFDVNASGRIVVGRTVGNTVLSGADVQMIGNVSFTSGNVAFGDTITIKAINANGSLGTTDQILTSNGNISYWSTLVIPFNYGLSYAFKTQPF